MSELEELAQSPDIVTNCCHSLAQDTSTEFREQAQEIARRAELERPINRAPSTIAASAVYLVGLDRYPRFSQDEIAAAIDVSPAAIRNCYRELAAGEDITLGRTTVRSPTEEVER